MNDKRQSETFFVREAAKADRDCKLKEDLIELSLVRTQSFDYEGSKGHWRRNHIIKQVEDMTDCLATNLGKVFEYNVFEYCYLFNHIRGHNKECENGLDF